MPTTPDPDAIARLMQATCITNPDLTLDTQLVTPLALTDNGDPVILTAAVPIHRGPGTTTTFQVNLERGSSSNLTATWSPAANGYIAHFKWSSPRRNVTHETLTVTL